MDDAILRAPEVLRGTGLSRTQLYTLLRSGDFPRPVSLYPGSRAVGWSRAEVQAWIGARLAERDEGRPA